MNFVNDTTVVSQFSKPRPDDASYAWLQKTSGASMYLSVITLFELRFGVEKMPPGIRRRRLSMWLHQELPATYQGRILQVTAEIADDAGSLLARTFANGFATAPSNALIAATARVHGYSVATLNRKHFQQLDVPLVDF